MTQNTTTYTILKNFGRGGKCGEAIESTKNWDDLEFGVTKKMEIMCLSSDYGPGNFQKNISHGFSIWDINEVLIKTTGNTI